MSAGDLEAKLEPRREDFLFLAGLALATALYYFSESLWLSGLGALAFVLLAVKRLDVALVFVVLSSPFYLYPKKFGSLAFSLSEFSVLACVSAGSIRGILSLQRQGLSNCRRWFTDWLAAGAMKAPATLFIAAATLSLFGSEFIKVSLREYRTVLLEPALFYVLILCFARGRQQVWRLIDAFLVLSAGVALFGIFHYFYVGMVEAADGVNRVLAVFHSPNALALFLGRSAPMFIALAFFYPAEGRGNRKRALYALGGVAVLACLFITYSRGAWLGVGAALVFVTALQSRRYLIMAAAACAAAALALIPIVGLERLGSISTSSRRLYLWQSAVNMIRDHPLLGIGLDNFLYQYPRYMFQEAWAEPDISHPHNFILDFWTRTGVLGLAALFWLQARFWQAGLGLFRFASDTKTRVLALALMASMVDFLIHGLIDNSFFLIDLALVFWLTYGSIEVLKEDMA